MNHIKILKRALNITVNYRVLWIFGILLALTTGGGGGGNGGGGSDPSSSGNLPGFNGQNPFPAIQQFMPALISLAIGFACLVLILIVIGSIARYVSETAVIRMVNGHEDDGEKLSFRQGFRLGWTRAAWKMFLMDLLVSVICLSIFLVLLAIAASPLLVLFIKDAQTLHMLGGVISAGLALLLVFATIVAALVVNLILLFARRALVLEDLGVRASLRRAFTIVKQHLGDVALMAVMMFGLGLAWMLLTIPVILAVIVVAALAGGLPALLAGSITNLFFAQGPLPWIVGAIVGMPIFLMVVIIPSTIISGWEKIYSSTAWTLTYREVLALDKLKAAPEIPAPEAA